MRSILQACLVIGTLMVQPIPSNDPNIRAYCVEYFPKPNIYKTGVVMLVSVFSNQFPVIWENRQCSLEEGEKK